MAQALCAATADTAAWRTATTAADREREPQLTASESRRERRAAASESCDWQEARPVSERRDVARRDGAAAHEAAAAMLKIAAAMLKVVAATC